jgi:hypothetical protein
MARTGLVGSWEAAAHGADGEEKWGERWARSTAGGFLWRPGGTGEEEQGGGRGVRGSAPRRGENGEERGAPGAARDSSGGRHRPPVGEGGQRHCRATGEGRGARVTQRERLTGGTGDSKAQWLAAVCERV